MNAALYREAALVRRCHAGLQWLAENSAGVRCCVSEMLMTVTGRPAGSNQRDGRHCSDLFYRTLADLPLSEPRLAAKRERDERRSARHT